MPIVTWSDTAQEDLKQIGLYIGQEQRRPSTAVQVMREIVDHCDYLARTPYTGTARPDLGADTRVTSCKRWVIIFRPVQEGVDLLRIVDGSRDWPTLF
jgi:toxin ParE1/3/4